MHLSFLIAAIRVNGNEEAKKTNRMLLASVYLYAHPTCCIVSLEKAC